MKRVARSLIEDGVASLALLAMVILPLLEIVWRRAFGQGIPASGPIVQHLTLWVGFLGAAIAARDGKLLALATGTFIPQGPWRRAADILAAAFGACAALVLAYGGYQMVTIEREAGPTIGAGIPTWVAQLVLPVAFALIAVRLVWRVGMPSRRVGARGRTISGLDRGSGSTGDCEAFTGAAPRRAVLARSRARLARTRRRRAVSARAVDSPGPQSLARRHRRRRGRRRGHAAVRDPRRHGGAAVHARRRHAGDDPDRDLLAQRVADAAGDSAVHARRLPAGRRARRPSGCCACSARYFGWIPGGTAVVCAVLCSFFTVFTGGSGVTILALGGVLFPALIKDGYREKFSLGLLTASGSLGLLLPPALPLILYAVVAQIPIEDIFIGGILPGILLTSMVAAWGVREGIVSGAGRLPVPRRPRRWRRRGQAKWELAMPVLVLVAMFSGLATAVEASALTALYALVVQTVIHRDLVGRALLRAFSECVTVIGGVLIILGVAVGFTNYLVGAQVPAKLVEWGAGPHHVAADVPAGAESLPARGRLADGDLRGDRRRRAADRAARRGIRDQPGASRDHLHRQPRARDS